jgi:hypothetical protein
MLYQVVGAATLSIFLRHFVWAVDTFVRLSMICVRVLMPKLDAVRSTTVVAAVEHCG